MDTFVRSFLYQEPFCFPVSRVVLRASGSSALPAVFLSRPMAWHQWSGKDQRPMAVCGFMASACGSPTYSIVDLGLGLYGAALPCHLCLKSILLDTQFWHWIVPEPPCPRVSFCNVGRATANFKSVRNGPRIPLECQSNNWPNISYAAL